MLLFSSSDYDQAIHHYENALKYKPDDQETIRQLELMHTKVMRLTNKYKKKLFSSIVLIRNEKRFVNCLMDRVYPLAIRSKSDFFRMRNEKMKMILFLDHPVKEKNPNRHDIEVRR